MTIIERIMQLLDEQDKYAVDLCRVLNVRTSTMSTWKTRNCDPPAAMMPKIADFLGVSLEYLLTGIKEPEPLELSDSEQELFEN